MADTHEVIWRAFSEASSGFLYDPQYRKMLGLAAAIEKLAECVLPDDSYCPQEVDLIRQDILSIVSKLRRKLLESESGFKVS